MKHKCKAIGCQAMIPDTLLMCSTHWRMVPRGLREDVLAKWKAFRKAMASGDCGEASDAGTALRKAQTIAQQAVICNQGPEVEP